jgi:hypothetical protein
MHRLLRPNTYQGANQGSVIAQHTNVTLEKKKKKKRVKFVFTSASIIMPQL